jgi:trans-aconitate 2-methyltransferase
LGLIKKVPKPKIIDLGCGTGKLTQRLHERLNAYTTLGIDSSDNMLNQSKSYQSKSLSFNKADIRGFTPSEPYDIVFSNAALQWVEKHENLFPQIFNWLGPKGQVAMQIRIILTIHLIR